MDINSIIDKLNTELEKFNNITNGNSVDANIFFTDDEKFNDDFSSDSSSLPDKVPEITNTDFSLLNNANMQSYEDIENDNEPTSLVTVKERRLLAAQTIFQTSIRVSLKAFLISISISFLNLFI